MHGTKDSMPLDLNVPHELGEQFDAIFNLGTAEHIFNVYQAFKSMHDWLKVGGQIIIACQCMAKLIMDFIIFIQHFTGT